MTRPVHVPATYSASGRPPWRVLPIVLLGNVLAVLDFFVVNVALTAIDRDLRAGPAALELLVAGYAAAYASGLVTAGRLGDAWGASASSSAAWSGSPWPRRRAPPHRPPYCSCSPGWRRASRRR